MSSTTGYDIVADTIRGLQDSIRVLDRIEMNQKRISELGDPLYDDDAINLGFLKNRTDGATKSFTGFDQFTDSSLTSYNVLTNSIPAKIFQQLREGVVYIKGRKYEFSPGSIIIPGPFGSTYFIGYEVSAADNDIINLVAVEYTDIDDDSYNNIAFMYEIFIENTAPDYPHMVVKENHPYDFPVEASEFMHNNFGTVIEKGVGANIVEINNAKDGSTIDQRKIKMVGDAILEDHGLKTDIPDSNGDSISLHCMYVDGSGKWKEYQESYYIPLIYNSSGSPTPLDANKYAGFRIFASKNDLNTDTPRYFAVMGTKEYDNIAAIRTEISNGTFPAPTNELNALELCQLGFVSVRNSGTYGYISEVEIEKETAGGSISGGNVLLASLVSTIVGNFTRLLGATDTTTQTALETLEQACAGIDLANTFSKLQTFEAGINMAGSKFTFKTDSCSMENHPSTDAVKFYGDLFLLNTAGTANSVNVGSAGIRMFDKPIYNITDVRADAYKPKAAGNDIVFKNYGGTELVRMKNGGYVGIGRTPTMKLDVYTIGSANIILSETTNNSDAVFKGKTALGEWSCGTGVGIASDCWNIYNNTANNIPFIITSNGIISTPYNSLIELRKTSSQSVTADTTDITFQNENVDAAAEVDLSTSNTNINIKENGAYRVRLVSTNTFSGFAWFYGDESYKFELFPVGDPITELSRIIGMSGGTWTIRWSASTTVPACRLIIEKIN
jgi:hypothetical protein